MNTAKQNFNQFVYTNQTTPETTKLQSEQKMMTLEKTKVSFAICWTLFWFLLPTLIALITGGNNSGNWSFFWYMMFLGSIFFNITNFKKRQNYKDVELMRLLMKINNFKKYENPIEDSQVDQTQINNPNSQINDQTQINGPNPQIPMEPVVEKKVAPIILPLKRQLDFNNLAKEKVIQILKLSKVPYSPEDSLHKLGEKVNVNDISWNKIPESLLKEVLDLNGITYKLNITKEDMVKLLE